MRIAVLISCEVWCWLIPFSSLNGAWFLQLIFDCASCGAWAPEAWKPRFQIFANLWKFNNRWNLKTWFLKIVYQRVSLSKIWAIHQNGRWRTILDPDRQPFLKIPFRLSPISISFKSAFEWWFIRENEILAREEGISSIKWVTLFRRSGFITEHLEPW